MTKAAARRTLWAHQVVDLETSSFAYCDPRSTPFRLPSIVSPSRLVTVRRSRIPGPAYEGPPIAWSDSCDSRNKLSLPVASVFPSQPVMVPARRRRRPRTSTDPRQIDFHEPTAIFAYIIVQPIFRYDVITYFFFAKKR